MENTKSCRVNRPDPYRDQALFAYKGLRWFYIFWLGGLLTFYDPFFLIMVSQPENLFSPRVIFLKSGATLQRHQIKLHSHRAKVQWAIIKRRIY